MNCSLWDCVNYSLESRWKTLPNPHVNKTTRRWSESKLNCSHKPFIYHFVEWFKWIVICMWIKSLFLSCNQGTAFFSVVNIRWCILSDWWRVQEFSQTVSSRVMFWSQQFSCHGARNALNIKIENEIKLSCSCNEILIESLSNVVGFEASWYQ